jgi:hypothetical protein
LYALHVITHILTAQNVNTYTHDFFFNLPKPSSRTVALGFTHPPAEMSIKKCFWGGKGLPARKAENLTAICEPTV